MSTTKRAAVLLAEGFEETEAVTIIDVLRRAGVDVLIVAVNADGTLLVRGDHDIMVHADVPIADLDGASLDQVVLPGGKPGAERLRDDERVQTLCRELHGSGRGVAAICAAPIALDRAGVLQGLTATSYPGFPLPSATYSELRVVEDGQVVTSRGPGTALDFSLTLVKRLVSAEAADDLRTKMLVGS